LLLTVYVITCGFFYLKQKQLLFPANFAKPVAADWQPTAGDSHVKSMIVGNCGKIQVAIWKIKNAKGTIMMFHGNGESLASIDDYAYAFHQLGYNLMAWDYPGYGRSSDCWFSQNDLLGDAENVYQWLTKQENPNKIYIFGYSVGTGIALYVESKHSQNPIFLVASYDSLLNVARDNTYPFLPASLIMRYPLDTTPWLDAIKSPIYLIHGESDKLIRPDRAKKLVENAKGKAKIEWVKSTGHTGDSLWQYRNQWLKRLLP
jgi:pimeloyl-ACP methyl ester carboxylesterase